MKKKNKKDLELEHFEENIDTDIAHIKEELTEDYVEDFRKEKTKSSKIIKILNIVFVVLIILMIMITVDIVSVAKYDKGPYFAFKTKTYKDGGTKVYYGLGYKVIKYNQVQGRRDKAIGFWTMPYNTEPLNTSALDLAIEFTETPSKSYTRYYKKFIRISSSLTSIDNSKKTLSIGYTDEGGKYTLNIVCTMADKKIPSSLETGKAITIIGTVKNFELKTKTKPNTLYINDCFAEQ